MSQPIQNCFERYEKKYFLPPAGQKALLQTIAPYIRMDFYGKYTINRRPGAEDHHPGKFGLRQPV